MRQTRVLIVDDSVVIRRKLAETLGRLPDLLVAGSTASGRIALLKIPLLRPDVVVLDSAMTEPISAKTLAAALESVVRPGSVSRPGAGHCPAPFSLPVRCLATGWSA